MIAAPRGTFASVAVAAAASLAAATAAVSLAAAPQNPQQPPSTFRAGTDIVQVDVVVQDKTGAFVHGLTAADFVVAEDGRGQRVEQFYLVSGGEVERTRSRAAATAPGAALAAPPSAAAAIAPRIFVVFFDERHLSPDGFKRSQAAALSLFDKHFKDGDVGGVVSNGRMAHDRLTRAREELLAEVHGAKPQAATNSRRMEEQSWPRLSAAEAIRIVLQDDRAVLSQAVERACAEDATLCNNAELAVRSKATRLANDARAETAQTGQELLAVLNGLSRFDGRKTVLLFSEGFFADEAWPLVQDAVGRAARANARVYTFDARGLDRSGMSDRLAGADPGGSDSLARLLTQLDTTADAVNSLAIDTGGFVIRNANAFDAAVAQVAADAGTYYVLGYRSDRAPDGQFRRLSVKVDRPGVLIRARRGYVATPRTDAVETARAAPAPAAASAGAPAPTTTPSAPEPESASPTPATAAVPEPAPAPTAPSWVEASKTIRVRPDAEQHVQTLSPVARDPDADAGWEAYRRGDVEAARQSLAVAAARPGAAAWVHYALGQAAYAVRDFDVAGSAWERVRTARPDFEPVYFDLVDVYLQQKDYDRGVRLLRDAEKRWPEDAEVMNALGVVQVARGSFDDAVRSFQRAIVIAPNDATTYFNLAKTLELRYVQNRRWVPQTKMWISNEHDRDDAIANYKRYLEMGGPYDNSAREGLARLNWSPR